MFQRINGAMLRTVAFGDGPRTLVAHGGWTAAWALWEGPFELLSPGWRCVGFDHRGAGASHVDPSTITVDAMVDDLIGVLDAHGIQQCILAAESMGGLIARVAAQRHPERFDGLVLVASPYGLGIGAHPLAVGARRDYPATVAAFVTACLPEPGTEHLAAFGRHMLLEADPECAALLMECCAGLEPDHAAIRTPTVLVYGEADAVVPPSEGERLAAALPNATLYVLDGIGHVPPLTAPREVAAIIERHFGAGTP